MQIIQIAKRFHSFVHFNGRQLAVVAVTFLQFEYKIMHSKAINWLAHAISFSIAGRWVRAVLISSFNNEHGMASTSFAQPTPHTLHVRNFLDSFSYVFQFATATKTEIHSIGRRWREKRRNQWTLWKCILHEAYCLAILLFRCAMLFRWVVVLRAHSICTSHNLHIIVWRTYTTITAVSGTATRPNARLHYIINECHKPWGISLFTAFPIIAIVGISDHFFNGCTLFQPVP